MSIEKKIEEMAKVIDEFTEPLSARDIHKADFSERFAEHLYNAGYSKQSEGEWIKMETATYRCSVCGHQICGLVEAIRHSTHFCPNCGAKMKGGNE